MSIFLIKAFQLILSLGILVFIHELGHFLFARLFKIRVDKFYLFFDPWFSLIKYKPKGSHTEYGIGWLPLGGYCKISGMVDESMDTKGWASEAQAWEFRAKPAWQRLLVMLGGVLFNVILAFAIYSGISYTWGDVKIPMKNVGDNLVYSSVGHRMGLQDGDLPVAIDKVEFKYFDESILQMISKGEVLTVERAGKLLDISIPTDLMRAIISSDSTLYRLQPPCVIDAVLDGGEAHKAGLESGDKIIAVAEKETSHLGEVIDAISSAKGDSATLLVIRGGEKIALRSYIDAEKGIGISFMPPAKALGVEEVSYGFFESIPVGIGKTFKRLGAYVSSLKYVATKEGASKIGGLGTIGSLFPERFSWIDFWSMTAFLSVMLAVMNILPIPGLDGGHIIFLIFEIITRRKLSIKVQERIQMAGLFFLLFLMLYANVNDIRRFFF
ncbi:RIP metalloprotease RseP [Porphyromonas sp.]|uniref:RIP metalloprotease RseP n=1 Tax=Porphyromonas sp. TaxID=1924944 RepID=UPI0026DBDE2E|nr:RIP metalloprotease RseP [Porphyromonas sp.]MDO4770262.1 RIP metalloprotease RseP [Porphyromonas sp.]